MNNNMPQLNFDMISKILNIRMEIKKEERLQEEAFDEWENKFIEIDNQLTYYFMEEPAKYNHLTKIQDAKYYSPIKVIEDIKLEKLFDL